MVQAELAYVLKVIDETSSTMEKIQSGIGLVGQTLGQLGGGFASVGNIMTDFAAGGPAGAVIGALGETAKGLQDCIKDATASEAVFTSLGAAVTRSGTSWDTVSAATKSALISMEETTTYSKDTLAGALERLMTFGLSYDDAMKALGESVDFAAAKHMDLESAATLVGKAMDGNTAILKRYGVDLETTKDQAGELKLAHDAAAGAIKALGKGVDDWVVSVTAAIGADTTFENGLDASKDKAQYLIDQFKAGNVDLPQFTTAMQSLGVQLDEAKMKGGSATEVLAKLNEQFGGAAQTAAGTYAGIQERLKNATAEVGEKIGTIFLPALASLTEDMIPVVDSLGKGVDAVTGWLTEVGKMPEVQGIISAVGDAFGGFTKYLQDLWGFMVDQFGPVLKELMDAFKELWDALSPITEALGEMFSAMTGGGDGMDLFKLAIQGIVLEIKGVVEIIKIVAPYIKEFADAFRAAADFITPILKEIHDGITIFLDDLKTAFQGFYNWLVGGSLWTDMWNQMLTIASQLIGQLISDLGSKLFDPMKNAFTDVMQGVGDLWDKGWQNLKSAGEMVWPLISGGMKVWEDLFKGDFKGALDQIQTNWDTAWNTVQTTFTTISGQINSGITTFLDSAKTTVSTSVENIQTSWSTSWQAVQTTFDTITSSVQTSLNTRFDEMKVFVTTSLGEYAPIATSALDAMQSVTNAALDLMKGNWQGTLDNLTSALTSWGAAAEGTMDDIMGQLKGSVDAGVSFIQGAWTGMTGQLEATTQAAAAPMKAATQGVMDSVTTSVTGFWNWLTGASYWPEHLEGMRAMTETKLGEVANSFTKFGQDVTTNLTSALQAATVAAKTGMDAIGAALGTAAGKAAGMTADAADAIHNAIVSAVSGAGANEAFQNLWTSAGGLWSQLVSGAKTAAEAIHDSFVALAGGGDVSNAFQALWASAGGLYTQLQSGSITTAEAVRESMLAMTGAVGSGMDAITFTTQDATQAFQKLFTTSLNTVAAATANFWNWLVGGSVWPEGMTAIETTTQTSMGQVTTIASTALQVLCDKFESCFEAIQNEHVAFWDNYFVPKLTETLTLVTQVLTQGLTSVGSLWARTWATAQTFFTETIGVITAQAVEWWGGKNGLILLFTTQLGVLNTAFTTVLTGIQDLFTSIFTSMVSTAQTSMTQIVGMVSSALAQVRTMSAEMAGLLASAQSMSKQATALAQTAQAVATTTTVTTAAAPILSPWPHSPFSGDLLAQWIAAMISMNPSLANYPYPYQTAPGEFKEVKETGLGLVHKGEVIGRPTGMGSVTVPVTVQLDGATIAKSVERRLVQQQVAMGAYGI
jgi:phage-related protein